MMVTKAELVSMGMTAEHFPTDGLPEILLSGRSNVGKSSFINTMTNRKNLAYTSSKPGKTQTLNFYRINDAFYFVDVPGYGYAKVSQKKRQAFGRMIEGYIQTRKELRLAILIVDLRHPPTEDDVLMYNYFKHYHIPVLVIATKADKIGKTLRPRHQKVLHATLGIQPEDHVVLFSSVTKEGRETAWKIITRYV